MPYDTGIKHAISDSMYQNKTRVDYPHTTLSAKRVPDLQFKNINEMFEMTITARVVGIDEQEVGGGKKEHMYRLEIQKASVNQKEPDEMSPTEILAKIEEEQVQ